MAGSAALVEALKRELKARGITYAQVARGLTMSEARPSMNSHFAMFFTTT